MMLQTNKKYKGYKLQYIYTKEKGDIMNKKRTNRFVAILNIISIVAFYIFTLSKSYLMSSIMAGETGGSSIYNSFIIDIVGAKFKNISNTTWKIFM